MQVAQNSECILIDICNELVLGIIISILQMDAWGGVDEWTFVTVELEERKVKSQQSCDVFVFLWVNARFSMYLAGLTIVFFGEKKTTNQKCLNYSTYWNSVDSQVSEEKLTQQTALG